MHPLKYYMLDVKRLTTEDGKTGHICFLQDNYSRFILAGEVENDANATFITETIKQGLHRMISLKKIYI